MEGGAELGEGAGDMGEEEGMGVGREGEREAVGEEGGRQEVEAGPLCGGAQRRFSLS